jgi:Eukaryotic cytochrome b561
MDTYQVESTLQERAVFQDSYKIFLRKRGGHACMMSIVFIVLFPFGTIATRLPLRGIRVITRIHAPIQILGLAMMIGAMGLGIDMAKNDLHLISPPQDHIVVGLLACSMIILFQPALGILAHLRYKRTGQKSPLSIAHRWIGRVGIILGWVNTVLGFRLVGWELVPTHSLIRSYVLLGVLGGLWFFLIILDAFRARWQKKERISSLSLRWRRGIVVNGNHPEKKSSGGLESGVPGS